MVSSRASLSIVELVYYIPALGLATWVASRHGFSTSSGWFFVILLALFRIVGSRLLISNDQNPNRSLRVAATILNIDGLSLLILVMLGLLKRV